MQRMADHWAAEWAMTSRFFSAFSCAVLLLWDSGAQSSVEGNLAGPLGPAWAFNHGADRCLIRSLGDGRMSRLVIVSVRIGQGIGLSCEHLHTFMYDGCTGDRQPTRLCAVHA
jgi:hypothetical protein